MRLSLKTSLIGVVSLLLLFLIAQSWMATTKIQAVNARTEDIATNWLKSVKALGAIKFSVMRYRSAALRVFTTVNAEDRAKYIVNADGRIKEVMALGKVYEALISSPEERKIWEDFGAKWAAYLADQKLSLDPKLAGNAAEIFRIDDTVIRPSFDKAIAVLDAGVEMNDKGAGQATADAASAYQSALYSTLLVGGIAIAFGVAAMFFVIFRVTSPLTRLNGALAQMAGGDLAVVIPGAGRRDEIGDLAKTVIVIRENAEKKARDEAEAQSRQEQILAAQRKREMIKIADDFERAVGEIVQTVSSASTELEASANTLTSTAGHTQEVTEMVASASEEASTNVQSVASATEEMASSVNEISRRVQDSAKIASEAVVQAEKTNSRIAELASAASRIGAVVELINNIAGQTNLLALNATIEAARAGEAGRGFAVVASEVKALAEQTAKATGEISVQIDGMQAATGESVSAIKEIGITIGKMSEISSTIASAVEEQGAATQEISRNVQQAAQGTQQVSANIMDVRRGTTETGSASSQVLAAAQTLSRDSNRLKSEVATFLDSVRAA